MDQKLIQVLKVQILRKIEIEKWQVYLEIIKFKI